LIVSGSSALNINNVDLSRRAVKVICPILSFREYLAFKHSMQLPSFELNKVIDNFTEIALELITNFSDKKISVLEEFHSYLKNGMFPTSFSIENTSNYYQSLNGILNKMIGSDIQSCYPDLSGRSIRKLKKLLAIISTKCPYIPNISDLTSALEMKDRQAIKKYLFYLNEIGAIRAMPKLGNTVSALNKPEKIYLHNPNFIYALSSELEVKIGTVRETFVALALAESVNVSIPKKGDFIIDGRKTFEVGGSSKSFSQLKGVENSYIIADGMEFGKRNKIPMWLLGFLW